jgi:hypothetical protein
LKNNERERSGGVAQVVDHLPSKCEFMSSNTNTGKKQIVCLRFSVVHKSSKIFGKFSAIISLEFGSSSFPFLLLEFLLNVV